MPQNLNHKLIIAISSRALFNLDDSHQVFEKNGVTAYQDYQIEHENEILAEGVALPLVKKLLALNEQLNQPMVEIILLSRNSADTGLRVFNSIEQHQLNISRAVFTSGKTPYAYANAFGAHLFLSANPDDVIQALNSGIAAAIISPSQSSHYYSDELRIAFDGDAVLFSDESERIFQQEGLEAFAANEKATANHPMTGGPFKGFLAALCALQNRFNPKECPIRTALVTARSAPAHERVIKTLRDWKIRIDEALFLGGLSKAEFLKAFGADIFFDDQRDHIESAKDHVTTGHVPHGVKNEK